MFTYGYDRWGNRWSQNVAQGSGPAPQFTFNTATNQITGYTYDAAGNMTNDGFHSYTYDAEDNILKVDGGSTATYVYDALNHRVQSIANGVNQEYAFNLSGQRASVWDGASASPSLLSATTYWNGRPVSFYNGATYFQHQDVLGTERLRTASDGSVAGSYQSLVFGDGKSASGADSDSYHFAQLDHDSESGTDHAQFRQYSSAQGRWLSPDPYDGSYDASDPQSFNRYSYVLNNPLTYVDPVGLGDPKVCQDGQIPDQYGTCWTTTSGGILGGSSSVTVTAEPNGGVSVIYVTNYDAGSSGGGGGSGSTGQSSAPNSQTRHFDSKKYNQCLQNAGKTLKVADTLGAWGIGSFLFTAGSTAVTAGIQKMYGTTATNLSKTAAGQASSAAESTVGTMVENALFKEGTVATIGKISGYVTVGATAVSVSVRACCAAQAY